VRSVAIFCETRNGSNPISGANCGDVFAFGGPRRPVSATAPSVCLFATHPAKATTMTRRLVGIPSVFSPPAMEPQTPTKQPALRLRGGRRTLLRSPVLLLDVDDKVLVKYKRMLTIFFCSR
jgi:hypothetical protein